MLLVILIFFIALRQLNGSIIQNTSENCLTRPKVIIHSSGSLDHFPNPDIVEKNTLVGYDRRQIECLYTFPIDWVINIHPGENEFEMRRNFYQKKNFTIGKDVVQEEYSVYMVLMYKPRLLTTPILISCQPTKLDDKCQRFFVEITPAKSPIFRTTATPSTLRFKALSDELLLENSIGNKSLKECEMVLQIQETSENGLQYKWEYYLNTSSREERVFTTNQGTYFRNLFRLVKEEVNCIRILDPNESCEGCSKRLKKPINAVVFYAKSGLNELFFKGIFNLSTNSGGPRKFYLERDVPLEEMVHLEVPNMFYVNQSVTVNCSVSVIYFAYGAIISSADEPYRSTPTDEYAKYREDGRRFVSRNITITNGNSFTFINCSALLWNYTRRVSKTRSIPVSYSEAPRFKNGSLVSENILKLIVQPGELNRTISCEVAGKPLPNLEWKFPNQNSISKLIVRTQVDSEDTIRSIIQFPAFSQDFLGTYNCVAWNYLSTISTAYNLQFPIEGLSSGVKAGIGSGAGILIIVFLGIITLIYRKIIMQRHEYRTKTAEAIEEFKKGINRGEKISKDKQTECHLSILELPYNDDFEISKDKWQIDEKILGSGVSGLVKQGSVKLGNNVQVVAIKMLKSSVEIEDFKAFLTELKIMAYIGVHKHVVSLVAACTQDIDQRDVMIGVEFCPNGSLHDYLISKSSLFQSNSVQNDGPNATSGYVNVPEEMALKELDLIRWSYHIAIGMEFLVSKKVLHGDLATRNVLLDSNKIAKISDFGLSRLLLDSSNYTKKSRAALPWKWLALESLKSMTFSSASDVWAYGVTLWEIFSLGETPYPGLRYSADFIVQLESGLRPLKPARASEYIYNIMAHCWNGDVNERVTFTNLREAFAEMLQTFAPSDSVAFVEEEPLKEKVDSDSEICSPYRNLPSTSPSVWYSNAPNISRNTNLYINA